MRLLQYILIACVLLIGCDPGNVTDIPVNPPRIVVQSQPEAGKPWEVYVSHTLPLLDPRTHNYYIPPGVPNATIKLFDNDKFVEDLVATGPDSVIQKFIGSTPGPAPGHTYSIKVEAPGYESVTAQYTQPSAVAIDDVVMELIYSEIFNENTDFAQLYLQFNVEVTFTDPPGDNYYYVALLRSSSPDLSKAEYVAQEYLYSLSADYQNQQNEYGSFFDDKKFVGKQTTLSFQSSLAPSFRADTLDTPYFFVSLRNFSKELYDYRTYLINPGPNYYDPYAQPSLVKSNVQNGLGVFAGFTADTKSYHYKPD